MVFLHLVIKLPESLVGPQTSQIGRQKANARHWFQIISRKPSESFDFKARVFTSSIYFSLKGVVIQELENAFWFDE